MITTDNNNQTLINAQGDHEDDLTMPYMAGAASRSEEIARLEEIESEWMGLSQDDGKAERAIERLTTELDEQLRINGMRAEREYVLLGKVAQLERELDKLVSKVEYVCEVSSHWNGASGFDVRDFKVLPPVGTRLYLAPPVTQPFPLPIPKEQP